MKFTIERESLLKPLQMVVGAVERKQTMPILGNVLIEVSSHLLRITATDTEVELIARLPLTEPAESGVITAPARKLIDICRTLPDGAMVHLQLKDDKLLVNSGRSRFTLTTLPAEDFPSVEEDQGLQEFNISSSVLSQLIDATHFSMAQQEVRYYLNGLLLELRGAQIASVATDGHRLAISRHLEKVQLGERQVIIPRKGVTELMRLMNGLDETLTVTLTANHIRVQGDAFTFTSKRIDGRFPDYERVIPRQCGQTVVIDRVLWRDALNRVAILSNEKYRGVRLMFEANLLKIKANNPDQEEAEEELLINYNGPNIEVGMNVGYLLDVLQAIRHDTVSVGFTDANSSLLIEAEEGAPSSYVIMPMRI